MLRHIVLLEFDATAGEDHLDELAEQLRGLPAEIPSIVDYTVGRDLGLAEGNATLGVVADFEDEAGYLAYRDAPRHLEVIDRMIRPHLASRRAIQFDL